MLLKPLNISSCCPSDYELPFLYAIYKIIYILFYETALMLHYFQYYLIPAEERFSFLGKVN